MSTQELIQRLYADRGRYPLHSTTTVKLLTEAAAALQRQADQLAAAQEMLKVATCPNRNCSDGMIINTGPDPQFEQCQWCYERTVLIDAAQGGPS